MNESINPLMLGSLLGGRGIYIEKRHFHYGELKRYEFGENGYLELHVSIDTLTPLDLGSDAVSLQNGAIQASGYVSWAWIYASQTIAQVEKLIAERADEIERHEVSRYQLACCVLYPEYERLNMRKPREADAKAIMRESE